MYPADYLAHYAAQFDTGTTVHGHFNNRYAVGSIQLFHEMWGSS